jgi:phosphoglycolate phosphatase
MRAARGLGPVALSETRRVTSLGARGLLGAGFGIGPEHADYAAMREEFLQIYENNLCCDTVLFPGIAELVDRLETDGLRWGIVTNKAERFAMPLLQQLGYGTRAACIIGGDTHSTRHRGGTCRRPVLCRRRRRSSHRAAMATVAGALLPEQQQPDTKS